jgi:NAD+ synthase (glutamine-hydrolysing)
VAHLRVAACQLNTVVGDLDGNVARILRAYAQAERLGADLAVFPELAVSGYPPEDLLLKPGFVSDNLSALRKVAAGAGRCAAVVGFVDAGRDLHNAAALCASGQVLGVYHKRLLPNYGVFDERRYFAPGTSAPVLFGVGGVRVGVSICEDIWSPAGPAAEEAAGGAELLVNINASPYHAGRVAERTTMLSTRAADCSCSLVYLNQVGGQDELVFDGASLLLDESGRVLASARQFEEDMLVADLEVRPVFRKRLLDPRERPSATELPVVPVTDSVRDNPERLSPVVRPRLGPDEEVYEALVLGTRDYVEKNGFGDVLVGLSGGVDSSLVAVIAADALGAARVHGVSMPSRFSSEGSVSDAHLLAERLGIDLRTVPIEPLHARFLAELEPPLGGPVGGLTAENLQSRIRGVLLMALSNAKGWIVLTTGNKSELAAGYSTLYGDTAGGFAVIKDVPKTLVYRLCRMRNERAGRDLVPESVLAKPPSAELRPGQTDEDSLPPYELLDPVLEAYVEEDQTSADLIESGFDPELVEKVVRLVDAAEYKRRQTPLGVRVTPKAFGKDRRMPITNRYTATGETARPHGGLPGDRAGGV